MVSQSTLFATQLTQVQTCVMSGCEERKIEMHVTFNTFPCAPRIRVWHNMVAEGPDNTKYPAAIHTRQNPAGLAVWTEQLSRPSAVFVFPAVITQKKHRL